MATASAKTTPVNLLVVDDVAENRAALAAILESPDYRIVEASSGPEALRQLVDQEFALLLVDIMMPEMDGFELARLVHERERTASVPIVFVTGVANEASSIFKGYRAGAVDYLVKPLDAEIVRAKVAVFVDLYRQRKRTETSLREKDILLREVHHRVRNNLQVVSSLLHVQGATQTPTVRELFAETESRVRSIALVHESLYQAESFVSIDMQSYLTSVVVGVFESFALDAQMSVRSHGIRLPIDNALACGLIVNELVTNALRHAFPDGNAGSVAVSLLSEASGLVLEVRDNGVGIPEDIKVDDPSTTGYQLVRSMVLQLAGTIEAARDKGTAVRVKFGRPRSSN